MYPVWLEADLSVVFLHGFLIGSVKNTEDFVLRFTVYDILVGDAELVFCRILSLLDLLLGEGTHLVRIDELWHERALRSWRYNDLGAFHPEKDRAGSRHQSLEDTVSIRNDLQGANWIEQ